METEKLLKVVEALGKNVFEGYNINQLARLSRMNVATIYRMLKGMEKKNLVLKEGRGNNVFYRLNLKNSSMLKYCELSSIERRKRFLMKNPGFYDTMKKLEDKTECAVLFGSFARNERRPGDIDILLLSGKKMNIKALEKSMKKPSMSPLYMEFSEFIAKLEKKNNVLLEIMKDGIVLFGEGKYWELVKRALHGQT